MFRTAEIGRKISKDEYEQLAAPLRIQLLEVQQRIRTSGFPAIVVFAGVDGAGKGETINKLNEWMDPRWIVTRAYGPPSDEERERPEFWRYWRDLPGRGSLGLFLRSWYSRPVLDAVYGHTDDPTFDSSLDRIVRFEQCLAADGALIVKFWLHLSRDAQKRLYRKWETDQHESWRVTSQDWEHWRMYDKFTAAAERTIIKTSTASAPWHIVEGEDSNYRELTVFAAFRDAALRHLEREELRRRAMAELKERRANGGDLADPSAAAWAAAAADTVVPLPTSGDARPQPPPQPTVLQVLDMSQSLPKKQYEKCQRKETARLHALYRGAKERGISTVLVFEGWDAAGKGGAIRRVVRAMDARDYQVIPIAAPSDEERAHHYLWRFWRHLQRAGRVTIFDRSWYGRVLVERVEGFAAQEEWTRAYAEINDFEQDLTGHGIVVCKYWMHITPDEQLRRFERRAATPYKRWKLTDDDWRNREKWPEYEAAVNDMVQRTSTRHAPWVLVEADDKRFARVKVINTLCERLEHALARHDKAA